MDGAFHYAATSPSDSVAKSQFSLDSSNTALFLDSSKSRT
jgi:hypothetical protein